MYSVLVLSRNTLKEIQMLNTHIKPHDGGQLEQARRLADGVAAELDAEWALRGRRVAADADHQPAGTQRSGHRSTQQARRTPTYVANMYVGRPDKDKSKCPKKCRK